MPSYSSTITQKHLLKQISFNIKQLSTLYDLILWLNDIIVQLRLGVAVFVAVGELVAGGRLFVSAGQLPIVLHSEGVLDPIG